MRALAAAVVVVLLEDDLLGLWCQAPPGPVSRPERRRRLLGALIPMSESIRTTGGTELLAGWLAAHALPPLGALALTLTAAMAVTPFLNNAATVLVMAPVAASLAHQLGLSPTPSSWRLRSGLPATS
jgi:hypothetical protein